MSSFNLFLSRDRGCTCPCGRVVVFRYSWTSLNKEKPRFMRNLRFVGRCIYSFQTMKYNIHVLEWILDFLTRGYTSRLSCWFTIHTKCTLIVIFYSKVILRLLSTSRIIQDSIPDSFLLCFCWVKIKDNNSLNICNYCSTKWF